MLMGNLYKTAIADTTKQDRQIKPAKKNRLLFWGKLVGLVLVLSGLVIWAVPVLGKFFSVNRSVSAARLRTAVVTRGDLVSDLVADGQVTASSYPTLYAPAEGNVELKVRSGEKVAAGQVLALIDSPELRSRQRQEAFSLEGAEAELERLKIAIQDTERANRRDHELRKLRRDAAQRAFERAEKTNRLGLINEIELEKARDDLAIAKLEYEDGLAGAELNEEKARFEVRNQQAQVRRLRLALEELERIVTALELRAPVDGQVGNVLVDERERIAANQPILTVIDLSAFEIRVNIPENYADDIDTGLETVVTVEGRPYAGLLSHISPEVAGGVVGGTVVFGPDQVPELKQNQRVSVRILLESHPGVLKVRRGPFLENFGGSAVYVLEGDMARLRPIKIGALSLAEAQVVAGLAEGDTIILTDMSGYKNIKTILVRQ